MEGLGLHVLDRPVRGRDLEAPREIGGPAEELLVPPVAEAADALRDEEPRRDAVHELRDVRPRALGDDRPDDDSEADPAPDAEPALPDRERHPTTRRAARPSS